MVWKVPPLRLLLLALIPLIPLSFAAAQEDPAAPAAPAPAEDPATAELDAFYDERLRTAPTKVKQLLDRLQAQRTATMTFRMGYTTALDRSLQELTGAKPGPSADVLKPQMDRAKQVMSRYREMRECVEQWRRLLAPLLGGHDVLLAPAAAGEAPVGREPVPYPWVYMVWTTMHVPSVTLPAFKGPNGLPIGAQLVGKWGDDRRLFAAARWAWRVMRDT